MVTLPSANNIDNASRKIKAVGDVTLTAAGNEQQPRRNQL